MSKFSTTEKFVEKAIKKHGDKYDYSNTVYTRSNEKVEVVCPKHGPFQLQAANHLTGHGCWDCHFENQSKRQLISQEDAIKRMVEAHEGRYDYSEVVYKGVLTPLTVICKEHGPFSTTLSRHAHKKRPAGCPSCAIPGFRKNKYAVHYTFTCGDMTKVGISNFKHDLRKRKLELGTGREFETDNVVYFPSGRSCYIYEQALLKYLRPLYKNPEYKFDGYTETFLNVDNKALFLKSLEILEELGYD
jgi:hypothetical protein